MSAHELFALLADDRAVDAALEQDKFSLDSHPKANLKLLYNHYIRSASTLTTRFRNIEALEVPNEWKSHVHRHGTDPTSIWTSQGASTPTAAFHAHVLEVARIEASTQSSQAVRNLCYLSVYDMLRRMFPEAKHTQRGLGPRVVIQLEVLSRPLKNTLCPMLGQTPVTSIVEWYNLGLSANTLATKFGAGCFFILDHNISADFLLKLPKTGSEYDKLVQELTLRLKLPRLLEKTRIGELGEATRMHFMLRFEGHDMGSLSGK